MEEIKIQTNSVEETKKLGSLLSSYLFPGAVITLSGDLGAGKTAFTGGIALGLGVKEKVSSPTFNIMKCYFDAKIPLFHTLNPEEAAENGMVRLLEQDRHRTYEGKYPIGSEIYDYVNNYIFFHYP